MLELKTPKGKKPFNSVQKSNTTLALPTIHKTIGSHESNHKSSYLQIAQNLSSNVQYDKKNTIYIDKQQRQLKNILKKMNYDTMDMINNIKPKRVQRTKSKSQLSTLAEKEVENSKKMINNLQFQISKLKEKYTRIIDHAEEQNVIEKIKAAKDQIQMMKQENLEARLSVDKEGNTIVREFGLLQDPKIKALESDAHLTGLRLSKLKSQTNRVEEQTKKLAAKMSELENKMNSLQDQYNSLINKELESISVRSKELVLRQKKYQILSIKQKLEDKHTMAKQKYYKNLKTLEQVVASKNATQAKIAQLQKKCIQTKDQSNLLDNELKQARRVKMEKSRVVQQYLSSQKIIEVSKIGNEFISQNSTDLLKAEYARTQFQELAEEKDRNREFSERNKRQNSEKLYTNHDQVPQSEIENVAEQSTKQISQATYPTKVKKAQIEQSQFPLQIQAKKS